MAHSATPCGYSDSLRSSVAASPLRCTGRRPSFIGGYFASANIVLFWKGGMLRGERWLPDEELGKPARVLAKRFIQRWDLYAQQLEDGRYMCVHEHLNVVLLFAHLRGEITLGTYVLDRKSQARFVALDADAEDGWESLISLGTRLASQEIPAYLEKSRRGGHLWLFFAQPVSGLDARRFAQGILAAHHIHGVEIFPKQDTIGEEQGSLIRLPYGARDARGAGQNDASGRLFHRPQRGDWLPPAGDLCLRRVDECLTGGEVT